MARHDDHETDTVPAKDRVVSIGVAGVALASPHALNNSPPPKAPAPKAPSLPTLSVRPRDTGLQEGNPTRAEFNSAERGGTGVGRPVLHEITRANLATRTGCALAPRIGAGYPT